jgi:hypothetical protein
MYENKCKSEDVGKEKGNVRENRKAMSGKT